MGYNVYGSDLESRMVEYSRANLKWLAKNHTINRMENRMVTDDATIHTWRPQPDFVASETYLGRPFTSQPKPEILERTIAECNLIIKKFLKNIHPQLRPGTRLCLAVPAWNLTPNKNQLPKGTINHKPQTINHFQYLPLVDQLTDLGYNQVVQKHSGGGPLLYFREDQIVARQLLVLQVK